jgi:hypothetical protein
MTLNSSHKHGLRRLPLWLQEPVREFRISSVLKQKVPILLCSFTSSLVLIDHKSPPPNALPQAYDSFITMTILESRSVLDKDDDTNSVNTDSTVENDLGAEQSVEKVCIQCPVSCYLITVALTDFYQILAERKTDQSTPLFLVKWEGYELHGSTWEPRENFVDVECLVNWDLHKREVEAGRAEPFRVASFEAALRRHDERRGYRRAKRAEKRRLKESRGPILRHCPLTKDEFTRKGTGNKAPTHDAPGVPSLATGAPSSVTKAWHRKQITPLFEPPWESSRLKRKRPSSYSRAPFPSPSINSLPSSRYSRSDEPTGDQRDSPSARVPRGTHVSGLSVGGEATKQESGTSNVG